MFKRIYLLIAYVISIVRLWLNNIRQKKPEQFDKAFKTVTFMIPFISCFAPALVTKNWSRAILEFIVLSVILVFQWSTFTNRIVEKENELQSTKALVETHIKNIEKLNKDVKDYTDRIGKIEKTHEERLIILNKRFDDLAGFSHSVSDNVKKIIAEISKSIDVRVTERITRFLQQSLTALETILSDHYGLEIRSSIKITIDENSLKTYARGRNNINSRGGIYHCYQENERRIDIDANYAYIAIVKREQKFFAEGNLLNTANMEMII